MRSQLLTLAIGTALLVTSAPGVADHPSKHGEGWANMPNDIHNTRIETRESGDNESFRDFVQYGEGADSVNRFDSDDTQPTQAQAKKGQANDNSNQGESQAKNQTNNQANNQTNNQANNQVRDQARNQDKQEASAKDRQRVESRSRMRSNTMSRPDRRGSDRGGSRGGNRRGGGKG